MCRCQILLNSITALYEPFLLLWGLGGLFISLLWTFCLDWIWIWVTFLIWIEPKSMLWFLLWWLIGYKVRNFATDLWGVCCSSFISYLSLRILLLVMPCYMLFVHSIGRYLVSLFLFQRLKVWRLRESIVWGVYRDDVPILIWEVNLRLKVDCLWLLLRVFLFLSRCVQITIFVDSCYGYIILKYWMLLSLLSCFFLVRSPKPFTSAHPSKRVNSCDLWICW